MIMLFSQHTIVLKILDINLNLSSIFIKMFNVYIDLYLHRININSDKFPTQ